MLDSDKDRRLTAAKASPYAMALAAGQLRLRCAVAALLLLCAAVPVEPALTFQDVRRIALASSGSAPPGANQRLATADGLAKAKALGIPINELAIAEHPDLAQTPVAAPPDDTQEKYASAQQPDAPQQAPKANARVAAIPYQPIAANAKFVTTVGTQFVLNGKLYYPGGTNWYDAIIHGRHTQGYITNELQQHWQNGVRVLRIFGFTTAGAPEITCCKGKRRPIQPAPFKYDEEALRYYDFFMSECARIGIRVIIALTNHEPANGGTQWYVDTTVKKGEPRALFYTANQTRAAYKDWVKTLANRKNTRNGRIYKQDPTIFAFELCNECHTVDGWEFYKKMYPGTLLFNWLVEMSSYLKYDLKVLPMVANGNEGYRMKGTYDPWASLSYPYLNWANSGLKGEDFNRNLYIKTLDFCTVHAYPKSFGLSNTSYANVNDFMLGDRMRLARSAGKPLIFEEFGAQRDYVNTSDGRNVVISSMLSAANAYGYPGTLVWQVHATYGDDGYYDFNYTQAGGAAMLKQFAWLNSGRARGLGNPFPYNCTKACTDIPPNDDFTCPQQASMGRCCKFGIQNVTTIAPRGYCVNSCNCGCNNSAFKACPTSIAIRNAAATGLKYAPKTSA